MIRRALLLSFLLATTISAQQFVGPPVDPASITVTKEIAYRTVSGQTLTFDLYRPAGNAVVAKPAEQTPLIAAEAVALFHEAGLPPALLALTPGRGGTLGQGRCRGRQRRM